MTKLVFDKVNFCDYYYYDETSPSCLRWKVDIINSIGRKTKAQVGFVAGGFDKTSGYFQTRVLQKTYQAHRIIYELFYGEIPEGYEIDHRDRDRTNNLISNLRATKLNNRNMTLQERNTSGICGVQRILNGWQATWRELGGKRGSKYFSSIKYGDEKAKSLAIQAREQVILRLNSQGAGYSETHGRKLW